MSIQRQYVVLQPTNVGATPLLDIAVEIPGSVSAPVSAAVGGTPPPAGWVGGNGAYYELRGRPLRIPIKFGATGFVPFCRLGYHLNYQIITGAGVVIGAAANLSPSRSFLGTALLTAGPGPIINAAVPADAAYGPIIQVSNFSNSQIIMVNLTIFGAQDEDQAPEGLG